MQNFVIAYEGDSVIQTPLGYALYGIDLPTSGDGSFIKQQEPLPELCKKQLALDKRYYDYEQ